VTDARTKLRAYAPEFLAVIEELEKRVGELEAGEKLAQAALTRQRERIEALEVNQEHDFSLAKEFDRQARWHATYNAALQGLLASTDPASTARLELTPILRAAAEYADRAHGPLEAPVVLTEPMYSARITGFEPPAARAYTVGDALGLERVEETK
jgi:23S rRNA A2030 N6-methylase RlmJ